MIVGHGAAGRERTVARVHTEDGADQSGPGTLLRTRTSAPVPSARTLDRPHLSARLDAAVARPVTLVSAGPGWGKTELVCHWAHHGDRPGPVAWLSLEPDDDDPARLWAHLLVALRRSGATAGSPLEALSPPVDLDGTFVDRVVEGLAELPAPVVLVLEDLHEVRSRAAMASLERLLSSIPARLRLVLVTRSDPALPVHRLRVRGDLTEVRAADLALDEGEARALLGQHGLVLPSEEVTALVSRTEGWATGLRLAALALESRATSAERAEAVARFAGDERTVADYLVAEVLGRLPARLRTFVLQTSVVDRLDAGLADALTGGTDGPAALDALARSGAPFVALDRGSGWYRCHQLFAEMCRHQLAIEAPESVPELHARAARWYARNDEPVESVRHAALGRDWTFLADHVVRVAGAQVFDEGGWALRRLLREVPPDVATDVPAMACVRVLALHDEADPLEQELRVRLAEDLLEQAPAPAGPEALVLALAGAAAARSRLDVVAAAEGSARALRLAAGMSPSQVPALARYVAQAHVLRGQSLVWLGSLSEAQAHFEQTLAEGGDRDRPARPESPVHATILARSYLSLVHAMRGSLRLAQAQAEAALDLAARLGREDDVQCTSAHLALVLVHLQRGDRPACETALARAAAVLDRRPDPILDTARRLAGARLAADEGGDPAGALATLDEVRGMLDALPPVPFLTVWLVLVRAEVLLAADLAEPALAVLAAGPDAPLESTVYGRLLGGRALLALGRPADAMELVGPLLDDPPSTGVRAVEAWLVSALAADRLRLDAAAISATGRALDAAGPESMLRPFHTMGAGLQPLLERHLRLTGSHAGLVARLLSQSGTAAPDRPPVHEPLTDRELTVLGLLPTLMSNAEIAAELYVSVNTVKAHLKSLYRKLGVTGRRAAVLRGAHLVPSVPGRTTTPLP
jgi:LuxR family maltose regulon positive regulatory protein